MLQSSAFSASPTQVPHVEQVRSDFFLPPPHEALQTPVVHSPHVPVDGRKQARDLLGALI